MNVPHVALASFHADRPRAKPAPLTDAEKRRALIQLSSASVAVIVALWILYMNWMVSPSVENGATDAGSLDIFKNGIKVIAESVETGIVNSYMYFHGALAESTTFTIRK